MPPDVEFPRALGPKPRLPEPAADALRSCGALGPCTSGFPDPRIASPTGPPPFPSPGEGDRGREMRSRMPTPMSPPCAHRVQESVPQGDGNPAREGLSLASPPDPPQGPGGEGRGYPPHPRTIRARPSGPGLRDASAGQFRHLCPPDRRPAGRSGPKWPYPPRVRQSRKGAPSFPRQNGPRGPSRRGG